MTIAQFNEKYRISVQVTALQDATLTPKLDNDSTGMIYSSVEEILSTVDFAVYDRTTHDEVLSYDGDNEENFLAEVYETFNIID